MTASRRGAQGRRGQLTDERARDDDRADLAHLRLFVAAWGAAALFHVEFALLVWREPSVLAKLTGALVVAAALNAIWRPGRGALTLLATAQLADAWRLMPAIPNHWLLAALVNVAVLLAHARAGEPSAAFRAMRAPVMVAVVVFYWWTGFWKLNADFMRPDVSCATAAIARIAATFRWIPDSPAVRTAVIHATIGMELVAPFLLLVPVTRAAAAVALLAFHLVIGLDAVRTYLNFGSTMVALLLLFLPGGCVLRMRRLLPAGIGRLARAASAAYVGLALVAVATGPLSPAFLLERWVAWLVYATTVLVVVAVAAIGAPRASAWLPAGSAGSVAWIVPLLVFVNGLAPVLGLKTRTSWQMYSNVRLEAAASNHLLVPRSLDLVGVLRAAPVRVVESPSVQLRDVAGTSLVLPWLEFRRRVALDPDAPVTWERAGERVVAARARDDPRLAEPLGFAQRKLMIFRPLGPDAATRCDW